MANGGRGRGRGRGRGGYRGGNGPMPGSRAIAEELDFTIQMFANAPVVSEGSGRGKGRGGRGGRGGQPSGPNSGSATPNRGRGRGGFDSPRGRGYNSPRGRGRGDDSFVSSRRGDYGIGASPRGRGRGRGGAAGTLSGLLYQERPLLRPIKFVPSVLTKVLFQEEEELIKPGVEDVDDTEQSHVPTADQVTRVFSSGNIPRMDSDSEDSEEGEEIEEVDFNEIEKLFDANATTRTTSTVRKSKLGETTTIVEEQFTGFYVDPNPSKMDVGADIDQLAKMMDETLSAAEDIPMEDLAVAESATEPITVDEPELFCIDVQPAILPAEMAPSQSNPPPSTLRDDDDDDDVIVYVAPHPRNTSSEEPKSAETQAPPTNGPDTSLYTPYVGPAAFSLTSSSLAAPEPPSVSSIQFSFSQTSAPATPGKARLQVPAVSTPRQAKAWKRKRGLSSRKKKANVSFGAFGALHEEQELHRQDRRHSERRRNDSDLEWGDTDDEYHPDEVEAGLEEFIGLDLAASRNGCGNRKGKDKEGILAQPIENGKQKAEDDDNGMEVDPEIASDLAAMRSFVGGLLGPNAGTHETMDDIKDAELMRMEDEEGEGQASSDSEEDEEEEDVLAAEEAMLISESLNFEDDKLEGDSDESDMDDKDSDSDDDDDDDQTPRTSFQARLQRLREKSRSNKHADTSADNIHEDESDEDEGDILTRNMTWADEDEDFIQKLQDMLDENEDVLTGRDRKQKNALFRSIYHGAFDDDKLDFKPAKKRKDKGKDLPPDLRAMCDKDRQAKAEYKKAREQARLEAAADPLSKKKGGKKGRKAMRAAAKLDPTITVIPNRVIDMVTLVQQIRRFIAEVGGPSTMSLPPTNKETRKNIHEMAIAFNLKSLSKGKGDSRYTTLTKKTRSGIGVDEAKVARIVRRSGGMGSRGDSFIYESKGKGPPVKMPRHREGDEVGKAAPKLTQANIGFRMLSLMGWQEGARIGFTGGLDAPLTAIIKNSKLGLGATM